MNKLHITTLVFGIVLGASSGFILEQFSGIAYAGRTSLATSFISDAEEDVNLEFPSYLMETYTSTSTNVVVSPPASTAVEIASSTISVHVPIFVYHSVRPHIEGEAKNQDAYDITPELLYQQLTYLKEHGYHTIRFSDIDAFVASGTPLQDKPVILSFDDGWHNQFEYAFPLLKEFGVTATFYIFTNPLEHHNAHWMSWANVEELDRAGMEIGGHTSTHPYLTHIKDDAALDREIGTSKKTIEAHLGHGITTFAYPFGMYNDRIIVAVARAGFHDARLDLRTPRSISRNIWAISGMNVTDNMSDFVRVLGE